MSTSAMLRLSSQHRALYCYLILSIWIFLLVAGMYKYIGAEETVVVLKHDASDLSMSALTRNIKRDIKTRRIFRLCNPPEEISLGSEARVNAEYSLESVLVFLRHGDRGPLTHVRNISSVNCADDLLSLDTVDSDPTYRSYESFIQNLSYPSRSVSFLGPFHGFPLLPPNSGECQLAQLTPVGVAQMLRTGQILKEVYGDRLGLGNGSIDGDDVVAYSTRYRRTFQSAIAFLYGMLSAEDLQKVILRESQSLAFCFNDCACSAAEKYARKFHIETSRHLKSHPAVVKLVKDASAIAFEVADDSLASDPHALRDALLAYVCHGARLPCLDEGSCVRMEHVTGLFAYTDWEARQHGGSKSLRRSGILRSYGLLRDVVAHVLRVVSERKPRLVVYSGHDKTLQYLSSALGIVIPEVTLPHYASRLVFEIYKNNMVKATSGGTDKSEGPLARDYYFRLLFDGRDLTNRINFCKGLNGIILQNVDTMVELADDNLWNASLHREGMSKVSVSYLCPIESIVRFLHDDYFSAFNATNFKDACATHP